MSAALIGGVLFPVDVLPGFLQVISYAVPLAPTLEALRQVLFSSATVGDITTELAALAAFAVVIGTAGAGLFAYALRRARIDGSLSHY
jgi:ABC-2 type transport system permease protein